MPITRDSYLCAGASVGRARRCRCPAARANNIPLLRTLIFDVSGAVLWMGLYGSMWVWATLSTINWPMPLGFAGSAPGGHPTDHFAGTVIGAPFCFTKNTRNLAGFVVLAFRETVCTSSGDS